MISPSVLLVQLFHIKLGFPMRIAGNNTTLNIWKSMIDGSSWKNILQNTLALSEIPNGRFICIVLSPAVTDDLAGRILHLFNQIALNVLVS